MVTKSKLGKAAKKRQKGKDNDLKPNKETLKDLADTEAKHIQGGRAAVSANCTGPTSCGCMPTIACQATLDCAVKR